MEVPRLSYPEFRQVCRVCQRLVLERLTLLELKTLLRQRLSLRAPALAAKIDRLDDRQMKILVEIIKRRRGEDT
jgi:hypothetical protein